jgi:hypothetical protein
MVILCMKPPVFPHSGQRIVCGVWRDIDHEKRTKCKVQPRHLNEWAKTPSRSASWMPPARINERQQVACLHHHGGGSFIIRVRRIEGTSELGHV